MSNKRSNRKQARTPDAQRTPFKGEVKSSPGVEYLTLDEIRRDGGTQPRTAIDWKHVQQLCEQIEEGYTLEPIAVFYDGESYWLADGFHRWHAHHNQSQEVIACVIHQGQRRDCVLYSTGANADNKPALPRSLQDKRRAVMTLLQDSEWKEWSDREIARRCKVSQPFVSKLRSNLTDNVISENAKRTYKTKHGTIAKMNVVKLDRSGFQANQEPNVDCNVTNHVMVKDDHLLFPGRSGMIARFPNLDAAIVEFNSDNREPIYLKHLNVEQQEVTSHIELAHHLKLVRGGLVEIYAPNNKGQI